MQTDDTGGIGDLATLRATAARIALDVERFRCKVCNKINGTKAALQRHMSTHTGERKYVCSYCRKAFTISSSLYRHIRALHDPTFVP